MNPSIKFGCLTSGWQQPTVFPREQSSSMRATPMQKDRGHRIDAWVMIALPLAAVAVLTAWVLS